MAVIDFSTTPPDSYAYSTQRIGLKASLSSGDITVPVRYESLSRITAVPGPGCEMRVYVSSSPWSDIRADAAAGLLTYAAFTGAGPTGASNWMAWPEGNANGGVTSITTSHPDNYLGDAAIIAVAIGGAGVLEVSR